MVPWTNVMAMKVKMAQLYPTLCDLMIYTVHGILQARILEWIAIPSPRDLPNPGIKSRCPTLQANSLPTELSECILTGLYNKKAISHDTKFPRRIDYDACCL